MNAGIRGFLSTRFLLTTLLASSLALSSSALAGEDKGVPQPGPNAASVSRSASNADAKFVTLPLKPQVEDDAYKNKRAKKLSDWVVKKLEERQVKVAVISRLGSPMAVLFDRTGMTHSGYVFRNPETNEWITYSLYADKDQGMKKSKVWLQSIHSFYYGQSGIRTDALMLIPPMEIQELLYKRLTAQSFDLLLPENEHYSLVAPIENPTSINCTKWVMLQYLAARNRSSDVPSLIKALNNLHNEPTVKANFLVKYILKKKPDVDWNELSPPNHIHTMRVDGMYKSPLFTEKWYYHRR